MWIGPENEESGLFWKEVSTSEKQVHSLRVGFYSSLSIEAQTILMARKVPAELQLMHQQ